MANNRTAIDGIHDNLNPLFKSRENPNWKALVEAIGQSDQDTADLIQEVRKQFFIPTASRPYIDKLAANSKVGRPKVVGMDDTSFRKYIPILAYQPKQVKNIMDQLLDIFFFKEATSAFVESSSADSFFLKNGWELVYKVDAAKDEKIIFSDAEFASMSSALPEEIAASINRQALSSFATVSTDKITKQKQIKIFSNTIGSKGSIEMTGGRANISLKFLGFIEGAGSGETTSWEITKIGSTITMKYISGSIVSLDKVATGDVVLLDMPTGSGSFEIIDVDLQDISFSYENILGQEDLNFDHTGTDYYVRFIRPQRSVVYTKNNRAMVWEMPTGEIIVEMPATPPIVRRSLIGSAHVNGLVGVMRQRVSNSQIEIDDASEWPDSGIFALEPVEEIQTRIQTEFEDYNTSHLINGRLDFFEKKFSYTGKSGNVLTGITPDLPNSSGIFEVAISTIKRDTANLVTVTTATPHAITTGDSVKTYEVSSVDDLDNLNGTFKVTTVNQNTFTYELFGEETDTKTSGTVRAERIGIADVGSRLYLTGSKIDTGIFGPYMWDDSSAFVLSSFTAKLNMEIKAGNTAMNLSVKTPNSIPSEQGFLIFDYGLDTQEGPVRYLYKPSDSTIALDPAYVFQQNHSIDSSVVAIKRKGAQVLSGLGKEYPLYVSDPAAARVVLQELIREVKSAGAYLRYIVRFPKIYYSEYDLYQKTPDNELD